MNQSPPKPTPMPPPHRPPKGLRLSTKLVLASLAFALPLAVLAWFMDAGFRHDVDIARKELSGISYLQSASKALHLVTEHRFQTLSGQSGQYGAGWSMDILAQRTAKALDGLARIHDETDLPLDLSPGAARAGDLDPEAMAKLWRTVGNNGSGTAHARLMDHLARLMHMAAVRSQVALDPAPDSHFLAMAMIENLPVTTIRLSKIQLAAINEDMGMSSAPVRDGVTIDLLTLFRNADRPALLAQIRAALAEDPRHYGTSPTLQNRLSTALSDFERDSAPLARIMGPGHELPGPAALAEAAGRARASAQRLLDTGLQELAVLVQKRMDSYCAWRTMGASFGAASVLAAAMFMFWAIRGTGRAVDALGRFARQVSDGDLDARVRPLGSPELCGLADSIRGMVGNLKHKIGSLNGILTGMTVPCLQVDLDQRLTFINQPYLDLFERDESPDDLLGMTVSRLYHGREGAPTITGECLKSRRPIRREVDTVTPKGTRVSVRYDVWPILDVDDELTGAFAVIVDLTELHRQQLKIERLAAFPEVSPIPTMSAAGTGALVYANQAARDVLDRLGLDDPRDLLPEGHERMVAAALENDRNETGIEHGVADMSLDLTYHPLPDRGRVHIYAVDVTERKKAQDQILHDAFHDTLTGLPNKALFLDRVEQTAQRASREKDSHFAVLMLDVDDFRTINDSLGHFAGDQLIRDVGDRLSQGLRASDTLARLGGDEFALVLDPLEGPEEVLCLASRIRAVFEEPFAAGAGETYVTMGMGIAMGGGQPRPAEDYLREADTALYRGKARGKGEMEVFDQAMHQAAFDRLHLETAMTRGVENREFEPFYQPLVDLASGRIHGFEALARWRRPGKGLVQPGRFIPLAEENGLISAIGAGIFEESCRQAAAWQNDIPGQTGLSMSVNLAVRQMNQPDIVDEVAGIIRRTKIDPALVKVEITESGIMDNVDRALEAMTGFKKLGLALAVDDFGTGYSSLAHLHRFPFDYLKVDRSFIMAMQDNEENMEIVRTVVSLAHSLGKKVIAEGIETPEHLEILRSLNCEFGQGFLFSKPLPASEARELLASHPHW